MNKDEYIKTITYNGIKIKLGLDDYGQSYFIEYIKDGNTVTESIGTYNTDYMSYIEYRFGVPSENCDIYKSTKHRRNKACDKNYSHGYCLNCPKRMSKKEYRWWKKRIKKFSKWLKGRTINEINIT